MACGWYAVAYYETSEYMKAFNLLAKHEKTSSSNIEDIPFAAHDNTFRELYNSSLKMAKNIDTEENFTLIMKQIQNQKSKHLLHDLDFVKFFLIVAFSKFCFAGVG